MPQKSPYEMVGEFHAAFKHPLNTIPHAEIKDDLRDLRIELIREEFEEFCKGALGKDEVWVTIEIPPGTKLTPKPDIVGIADALADMVYVIAGAAHVYGIDLDAVFAEVHRSNMAKLGPGGKPIYREDGKVLKPEGWTPPDVAGVLGVRP